MARRGARGAGGAGGRSPRAAPGQVGDTPLHLAAIYGHVEVAEKLLAAGAAVGATDERARPSRGGGGCRGFYNSDLLSASF